MFDSALPCGDGNSRLLPPVNSRASVSNSTALVGTRYAVLLAALHPGCWYGPRRRLKVDLIPGSFPSFAGAASAQDDVFHEPLSPKRPPAMPAPCGWRLPRPDDVAPDGGAWERSRSSATRPLAPVPQDRRSGTLGQRPTALPRPCAAAASGPSPSSRSRSERGFGARRRSSPCQSAWCRSPGTRTAPPCSTIGFAFFSLRHVGACSACTLPAACSNVGMRDCRRGSVPWWTARAFSSAAARLPPPGRR